MKCSTEKTTEGDPTVMNAGRFENLVIILVMDLIHIDLEPDESIDCECEASTETVYGPLN